MVKKKIKVNKYELFMCYKHLPEDLDVIGFYFLRNQVEPIPVPPNEKQAECDMPACFETGTIGATSLKAIEKMLTHVYIPMLMIQGM